jgi:large subunit ribosomal protein L24
MRRTNNKIPKLHVKKGDTVKVLSGDDKGKTGRVIEVVPGDRKAFVDGVNIMTKHSKPTAKNPDGGRVKTPAAVHVSKLMVVDPKSGEPTRIGRKENNKGQLVRYAKKSGEEL